MRGAGRVFLAHQMGPDSILVCCHIQVEFGVSSHSSFKGFPLGNKVFLHLKPPDKPPFPNSKFTWIENLNKNQLGIMWIPLKIAFTTI